jgi:hypothetical protein
MKSGSLNLLEPSGPVQACNGIALTLRVITWDSISYGTQENRSVMYNGVGEGKGMYSVLVVKPEGKSPLGRPRHRWKHNNRWIFRK